MVPCWNAYAKVFVEDVEDVADVCIVHVRSWHSMDDGEVRCLGTIPQEYLYGFLFLFYKTPICRSPPTGSLLAEPQIRTCLYGTGMEERCN